MAINIIDPQQPGRQHVDSYWAATAGPEVENTPPVTADMDVDVAIIGDGYEGTASTKLQASPPLKQSLPIFPLPALRCVYQRAMYQVYELQDRLP
jgi:hypothetical protein